MSGIRWTEEQWQDALKRKNGAKAMPGVDIDAIHAKRPEPPKVSFIEVRFEQQLIEHGFEPLKLAHYGYVREYFHIPGRDFRLDFAWPTIKVGVEIQGGAHRIKGKFKADIEKRALGLLAGWRVLEVSGDTVRDGRAIEWLKALIG